MPIDVRSLNAFSFRRLFTFLPNFVPEFPLTKRQVFTRSVCGLLAIVLVGACDSLLKSYKYYSRIVDARLATGYVNSRPGLYAAPRTIRAGQKLSQAELIKTLRRSGYVENKRSNIWNGSFRQTDSAVDIQPSRSDARAPTIVRVSFENGKKISELTSNDLPLESYVLEPEVLSNDVSMKDGKHESLTYSEIPPVLVHAILSIEDQRFFQHSGVDPLGIARAMLRNVEDDQSGQGGSTITQQLVKNTYLSPEKTFKRKYAEAMLAFALERRLSKQDIFALYCSEIYLGQRGALAVRGVKEAARVYFGKELRDLSLEEAATIAGMIQSPARYSPVRHAETAQARRVLVLQAMEREGFITAAEADAAGKASLNCVANQSESSIAPYFVDYVNQNSDSQFAASPASHRVYTTIDVELQQLAESTIKQQLNQLDSKYKNRAAKPQAALVALDPKTGNVLAMVGGRDYAQSQLNRATDARRQPGSTFKPFVYAAALEDGLSPVRTFNDAPREFLYDHNKTYRPANYGGGYSMRDVTMRSGLVNSLNVVTVDIAMQTGLARVANLAHQFGLPRPERFPSLALGTKEVTPLELAAAYAAFVNDGRRVVPKVISSVGEPQAAHSFDESPQVIRPTTSYMITNMLAAIVDHGTARGARNRIAGTAIAGKTGTSRDGWFVGYTPNLVCVVWIGFDDNQQLGLTGAEAALPAWVNFVKGAVELKPELGGRNFECPEGIEFVEIDADNGSISTLSCPHRELIAVTERLAPNVECFQHGNLPFQAEVEKTPSRETSTPVLALNYRSGAPKSRVVLASAPNTTVDVDFSGKRRLITDLR